VILQFEEHGLDVGELQLFHPWSEMLVEQPSLLGRDGVGPDSRAAGLEERAHVFHERLGDLGR